MYVKNWATLCAFTALLTNVAAQLPGCSESAGNWYCNKTSAVTYNNFGKSGEYDRVVDMNGCKTAKQAYSGSLAPLDEEVGLR